MDITVYKDCDKIYALDNFMIVRARLTGEGKTLVFTNGCYDLIHPGHIRLLQKAKTMGDFLLVGLNGDASIKRLKGEGRPIMPLEARLLLLCSLAMVDGIIVFEEDTPMNIIDILKPDSYVKGIGYSVEELPEISRVTGYGGRVILMESLSHFSTTGIINKIRSTSTNLL